MLVLGLKASARLARRAAASGPGRGCGRVEGGSLSSSATLGRLENWEAGAGADEEAGAAVVEDAELGAEAAEGADGPGWSARRRADEANPRAAVRGRPRSVRRGCMG